MATNESDNNVPKRSSEEGRQESVSSERMPGEVTPTGEQAEDATGSGRDSGDNNEHVGGNLRSLPSFGTHMTDAFHAMADRLGVLAGIYAITFIVSLAAGMVPAMLTGMAQEQPFMLLAISIGVAIVSGLVGLWVYLAGISALLEDSADASIGESLSKALTLFLPYIWIVLLSSLAVAGGFVLLVVPGVIVGVLFSLAGPVYAAEGRTGIRALLTSREYIRGHGVDAFLRYVVISILGGIVTSVVGGGVSIAGAESNIVGTALSQAVNLVVTVYAVAFGVQLYKYLRAIKGDVQESVDAHDPTFYIILMVIGVVVIGLITTFVVWVGLHFDPQAADQPLQSFIGL